jgi:hypothetical protein
VTHEKGRLLRRAFFAALHICGSDIFFPIKKWSTSYMKVGGDVNNEYVFNPFHAVVALNILSLILIILYFKSAGENKSQRE